MTSLDSSGTSTKPETDRAHGTDRRTRADGRRDVERGKTSERRCSPDPFVATDRYRLTMPYDDRI